MYKIKVPEWSQRQSGLYRREVPECPGDEGIGIVSKGGP